MTYDNSENAPCHTPHLGIRNLCLRKMSQSALSDLAEAATADIEDQGWASIKRAQPIIEQWVSAGVPAPRICMRGHRLSERARGGLLKLLAADRLCACVDRWQREPNRTRAHGGWVCPRTIRRCLMRRVRLYAPWSKMSAAWKAKVVTTVREVWRWRTRSPQRGHVGAGHDRDSRDPGLYMFTFFQGSS